MAKMLVTCYSRGGNTEKMAQLVSQGAREAGVEPDVKRVEEVDAEELLSYDAIVIGSSTYYGEAAAAVRKLFDDSVAFHGKLQGKVGGAFASSANVGGGNETTILSILHSMLIHGMIVQGTSSGDHYGPVSIGEPDERVQKQAKALGRRVATLAERLFG